MLLRVTRACGLYENNNNNNSIYICIYNACLALAHERFTIWNMATSEAWLSVARRQVGSKVYLQQGDLKINKTVARYSNIADF